MLLKSLPAVMMIHLRMSPDRASTKDATGDKPQLFAEAFITRSMMQGSHLRTCEPCAI